MNPRAFLGVGGSLYKSDDGYQDGATAIDILAESQELFVAGVGGEAMFNAVYLAVRHDMTCTLRLTPILDGTELAPIDVALTSSGSRVLHVFEIALAASYERGGSQVFTTGLRGEWFALRIETFGGIAAGDLIIERAEIDVEGLQEQIVAENAS